MKKLILVACFILVVAGLYIAAKVVTDSLQVATKKSSAASCTHTGRTRLVTILDSKAQPAHTTADLCDKLKIENEDSRIRLMAFGVHDKHQSYDGVEERVLDKGQSFSVVLNQVGTFKFHDHLDDSAQGTFTVR